MILLCVVQIKSWSTPYCGVCEYDIRQLPAARDAPPLARHQRPRSHRGCHSHCLVESNLSHTTARTASSASHECKKGNFWRKRSDVLCINAVVLIHRCSFLSVLRSLKVIYVELELTTRVPYSLLQTTPLWMSLML